MKFSVCLSIFFCLVTQYAFSACEAEAPFEEKALAINQIPNQKRASQPSRSLRNSKTNEETSAPSRSQIERATYFDSLQALSNQLDELLYWWQILEGNFRDRKPYSSLIEKGNQEIGEMKAAIQQTQNTLQNQAVPIEQVLVELQKIQTIFNRLLQTLNLADKTFEDNPYYRAQLSANLEAQKKSLSSSFNVLMEEVKANTKPPAKQRQRLGINFQIVDKSFLASA